MAKSDLVGGALWERYSQKVTERMNNPRFMGEISPEQARDWGGELVVAEQGAEACGDAVRLYWAVDPETHRIKAARFKSFGCGTAIASSDVMAEMCVGRTVEEARKITNIEVERALRDDPETPAVPPQKMHCSVLAYDVIKKAAAGFLKVDAEELEEEEIVCECARVSLKTLKEVIRINDLKTLTEVTHFTKAGGFCKSCLRPGGHESRKHYLEDILKETRAEMERERLLNSPGDFSSLNLIRRHKAVEAALENSVRPLLFKDGGSVEVADMTMEEGRTVIFLNFGGSCAGCAARFSGTRSLIEEKLRQELDPLIDVVIV
ncbi:MAG: iron-sulfur cluster assembly scaffold protein [Spirochaetales bacterium]|jgi:NifU-like protein|nr:iron-sulfur cluster assembly scaffold protein [Spirochaetales bacterium]